MPFHYLILYPVMEFEFRLSWTKGILNIGCIRLLLSLLVFKFFLFLFFVLLLCWGMSGNMSLSLYLSASMNFNFSLLCPLFLCACLSFFFASLS